MSLLIYGRGALVSRCVQIWEAIMGNTGVSTLRLSLLRSLALTQWCVLFSFCVLTPAECSVVHFDASSYAQTLRGRLHSKCISSEAFGEFGTWAVFVQSSVSFRVVFLQCFSKNLWMCWECSAKVMSLSVTVDVMSKMYFLKSASKHCEGKRLYYSDVCLFISY